MKPFCLSLIRMCSLLFLFAQAEVTFWCISVSKVKGLLEAAAAQIVCLGLGAGLLPASHRMWGILSGSTEEGRPGFKGKRKWSGDGAR